MSTAPERWIFEHLPDDTWCWRLVTTDREPVRSPQTHRGISAAINDAMLHGFLPKSAHWLVDDHTYTTHYEPGKDPDTLPKPDATKRPN